MIGSNGAHLVGQSECALQVAKGIALQATPILTSPLQHQLKVIVNAAAVVVVGNIFIQIRRSRSRINEFRYLSFVTKREKVHTLQKNTSEIVEVSCYIQMLLVHKKWNMLN